MQEQTIIGLTTEQMAEADKLVILVRSFPPDAQKTVFGIIAGFRAGMDYQAARPVHDIHPVSPVSPVHAVCPGL